jgi:hypothetical protein
MSEAHVLGVVAAEQMAAIEADGEGEVQVVCTVVGIEEPDGERYIRMRSNCPPQVQLELLSGAQQGVIARFEDDGESDLH